MIDTYAYHLRKKRLQAIVPARKENRTPEPRGLAHAGTAVVQRCGVAATEAQSLAYLEVMAAPFAGGVVHGSSKLSIIQQEYRTKHEQRDWRSSGGSSSAAEAVSWLGREIVADSLGAMVPPSRQC